MKKNLSLLCATIGLLVSTSTFSQVSNDNEDGVNKVDERQMLSFVPGQAIVKFKDESSIQVQRNAKGRFRAASINAVDAVLRDFGVDDMEKLFPAATPKPQNKLRRKAAPNGAIVQEKNLDKVFWVKTGVMSSDSTQQLVKRLQELPDVEYAEPNYYAYITADMPSGLPTASMTGDSQKMRKAPVVTTTDASVICANPNQNPLYFRQYGITQQKIHQLWNKPIINNKRPVIAILDTGVDITHPDLVDNLWTNTQEADGETAYDDDGNGIVDDVHGWNFVEDYYDLTDRNGHGTHCAGIAAATNNTIGIVGANPLALIMPVKVMSDRGLGDVATIVRGIVYAVDNGADVLSMSFGGETLPQAEKDALDYAYQTAILVASAGNNGANIYNVMAGGTMYPAAYYLVLGVEASASNLQRASFSNYDPDGPIYSEDGIDGRNYEVRVPGDKIWSTLPNGRYDKLSGTSMSAPLFAGAVSALLMVKDYPSKDVLYGDLIHLNADFAQIYSDDTPRTPKIDLVAMNVDDNVEGNSNIDGQVDVGETIRFSPVLRNTWANATDIQLQLTVDPTYSTFVNIDNPNVAFGNSLSAYGRATAQTPIRVSFADNIGDNTRIKFVFTVTCPESAESFSQDVYVTVNNMVKISGLISEDRTLTADHVYYVNENLAILEGATLTIEPGTRLEFAKGKGISSSGKLVAKGTPENPIVFTGYRGAAWSGILSHNSQNSHRYGDVIYTNNEMTLFTLLPTETTPNPISYTSTTVYAENAGHSHQFDLYNYFQDWKQDMTDRQNLLTDPDYITPSVLQMLHDYDELRGQFASELTQEAPYSSHIGMNFATPQWIIYDNPRDTISYCRLECISYPTSWTANPCPYMKDCVITTNYVCSRLFMNHLDGIRNNISVQRPSDTGINSLGYITSDLCYSNIVNNYWGKGAEEYDLCAYKQLNNNNYFNNYKIYYKMSTSAEGDLNGRSYSLGYGTSTPGLDHSDTPSYLGSAREDILRPYFYEIGNAPTYGQIDLSNMPTRPYAEAHGIVWKVCVNGKDAQDEFEELAPLGVGKHKFEVYFNRPMNKAVAPQITFGVREPYTQHAVNEDGEDSGWNDEGTIYTAYVTISGKTMSDGLNRIYVQGAEDNEYFECPYEKTRFNININAAGSLATGFAADAGMGRVDLTWNNENNDFDDAMGFNVYRYTVESETPTEPVCLNTEVLDVETTSFTDYSVTPGETYYYYYKVLSTDLQEYDVSNVVAATPLTSEQGDANGSGDVDVADVITTVNYAAGMSPKPFIFEAADMNADLHIDILDVVGIIQKILNPSASAKARMTAVATYTVEDGIVYVETPVDLAGVQLQLNAPEQTTPEVLKALNGFEHASAWLTNEDYLFLGYNMSGKTIPAGRHALLNIGGAAQLRSLRLSDTMGSNVIAEAGNTTAIEMQTAKVLINTRGIYNLNGQKVAGKAEDLEKLPKGVYVVDGVKIVK